MSACEEIGARIKTLREKKGLTQAELGEQMHTSRELVNQWERGARDLKTGTIIELARYFEVSCDYILTGVKAQHLDMHEYLGLSESALNTLHLIVEERQNGSFPPGPEAALCGINSLLEHVEGLTLATSLGEYLLADFAHIYFPSKSLPSDRMPIRREDEEVELPGFAVSMGKDGLLVELEKSTLETAFVIRMMENIKKLKEAADLDDESSDRSTSFYSGATI